jgi:hypothetical protein
MWRLLGGACRRQFECSAEKLQKRPGVTSLEYLAIISLILVVIILAAQHLGLAIRGSFANSADSTSVGSEVSAGSGKADKVRHVSQEKDGLTRMTCQNCGSEYEVTKVTLMHDKDKFPCAICGHVVYSWDGAVTYFFKLTKRGQNPDQLSPGGLNNP